MDEGDVVVGADAVTEGGKAFLDTLNLYGVGEGIADVLKFLIGGDGGDKETVLVAGDEATNGAGFTDCGVDDGDVISELLFEDGVEVLGSTEGTEAVSVGELGKDTDVVGGFKTGTESHCIFCLF